MESEVYKRQNPDSSREAICEMTTVIKAIFKSTPESTLISKAQYVLAPNVILLLVSDGTARVLNFEGYFYAVPATGAEILQETLGLKPVSAALNIAVRYGIDVKQVEADLESFLQDLKKNNLIYRSDSHFHASRVKRFGAVLILFPTLYLTQWITNSLKAKVWILLTLAYIFIFLFGWSTTIAVWHRYTRKTFEYQIRQQNDKIVEQIDETVRAIAAKHLLKIDCKERSLCCWFLIRSLNLPAKLILGVDLFPLVSHCWCEFESRVLTDYEERCERFTQILCYE